MRRFRPSIGFESRLYYDGYSDRRYYIAGVRVPRWAWRVAYRILAPKGARQ